MAIAVGSKAPEFTLLQKVGLPLVSLTDLLQEGPAVVLFFPLAFSGVCNAEMCLMAEDYSRWDAVGAKVVGISSDSSYVNVKFAEETGVPFPLLSDFNKDVMTAYGVRDDDFFGMRGVAKRSAFVVAQDGTVAYAWVTDDADVIPPFDEVHEAVKGLS